YILNVDETKFLEYINEKYRLEPLKIDSASEEISPPVKSQETRTNTWGEKYLADSYTFRIIYQFEGKADLFSVRPNPCKYETYNIDVNSANNTVSFTVKIFRQDVNEFNSAKSDAYSNAFKNL